MLARFGVFGLLSASLMVALGDAFRSGADQALLHRSCAVLARSQDFQNIEAKTHAIELVALIGLILGGGAIVDAWGYAIGWLVEITLCSAGLMMACATIEPPADAGDAAEVVGRGASAVASSMPCRAGELKRLIKLIVPASLLGSTAAAALFLAQTAGERDPSSVTVLVASVTCAEAAGSALAGHLTAPARMQIPLAFLGAILAVTPIVWTAAFLPAVAGLSFLMGIAGPLRAAAVQSVVSDAVRARAASMASATDKALTSLALVCAGALAGRR